MNGARRASERDEREIGGKERRKKTEGSRRGIGGETGRKEPRSLAAGDHFTRIPTISRSKELANVKPARSHPRSSRSKEECQFAESPLRGGERHGTEIRETESRNS